MPSSYDAPPTTPSGPRKRKLAARLADQDNVAQLALKQQCVALQCHRKAMTTSTSNNISDAYREPTSAQPTHRPHPNPECHYEAPESIDDDSDDTPVVLPGVPAASSHKWHHPWTQPESNSSKDDSDILKEFVPKKQGHKKGGVETETPEQELGQSCLC